MSEITVAAVSTPRAPGGIAVIRISGEAALDIADRIFEPVSSVQKPSEMNGYTCAYGRFAYDGEMIDDGILTVFKAPRSYTGENVVELSCHGGLFVTDKLLRAVYSCGASPAGPGEFTKRAFINGKLTLTQAEAVMDIISAEGASFHRCAEQIKDGALFARIQGISGRLTHLLGEIGAWIDYPEDDIPEVETDTMTAELESISSELKKLAAGYDCGRILKNGIDTVIAGKPNVGKSTLMNLLSGYEKSIVTDIAGTTRDVVEESVRLGDIILRLSDTAGIRDTDDTVEGAGIRRTFDRLSKAELVIALFDNSLPLDDDDEKLINACSEASRRGVKVIACINKTDKESNISRERLSECFEDIIEISAKNGDNADVLQKVLYDKFIQNEIFRDGSGILIANERQKLCVDRAVDRIDEAIGAVKSGITLDAVNIILDEAENALLELTGERATEAVVNEVFSHFCVGK
ncbi:MAG: tRNA uridine-5-carboxymethylaminomethyl(34) synthesis GTPase MnmE [Huintestinicola sp.]